MFVSDKFVFVELHKTGCTHIGKLLSKISQGQQQGKHNRPTPALFAGNRTFIGSIRNPWEWYISLWAYGCDRKGALYHNVTRKQINISLRGWQRHPLYAAHALVEELQRDTRQWRNAYADVDDPECFRNWLKMVHDPSYWKHLREGYSSHALSQFSGLLTFRYLSLFCHGDIASIKSFAELQSFEQQHCYISHFIRTENLEKDILISMDRCGVDILPEHHELVFSSDKTNTSSRVHGAKYYYDNETLNIVTERDTLLIEKFGYTPPAI